MNSCTKRHYLEVSKVKSDNFFKVPLFIIVFLIKCSCKTIDFFQYVQLYLKLNTTQSEPFQRIIFISQDPLEFVTLYLLNNLEIKISNYKYCTI